MTARQEQLADLLFLRLYPLMRLFRQRLERMMLVDGDLFDEGEYAEEADKLIRADRLASRISSRLPASELQVEL